VHYRSARPWDRLQHVCDGPVGIHGQAKITQTAT
jgi:hypothetical protein